MKEGGGSGLLVLLLAGAAVLFFSAKGLFPVLTKALSAFIIVAVALIILLIVIVMYFGLRKGDKRKPGTPTVNDNQQMAKGRRNIVELRSLAGRIKNSDVKKLSDEICDGAEKILTALKNHPDKIQELYQFFSYYLPTLTSILKKYVGLEEGEKITEEIIASTSSTLESIRKALEKQHDGIFDDDVLDMSVEMEALTTACKRDGLLTDEDFGGTIL